ncbi:MAG: hypothetical protein JO189_15010 [Deltaproteobacteria bacterium]|nr:hypothetical protein [Deltaproteobacteria bacterium]
MAKQRHFEAKSGRVAWTGEQHQREDTVYSISIFGHGPSSAVLFERREAITRYSPSWAESEDNRL